MVLAEGPCRILVVDDDAAMRRLFSAVLDAAGYTVGIAADGREALQQIEAARPDLVVLDLMMPVMDGWTVLERLRQIAHPPPVVIVSATADCRRAAQAGAVGCLSKPVHLRQLLDTCERVLA